MKAVWYDEQGPASKVLQFGTLTDPEPGPGEVRVKLKASAVNRSDTLWRSGSTKFKMTWPRVIPNSDGAGIVDQVGYGVSSDWLGKRVWLYNGQRFRAFGTAAEFITLSHELIAPLPDKLEMAAGATLGIPCMTAHRCVFAAGPVQGKTLLIAGGAGAVGHYAIQLGKWAGATVITTVSGHDKRRHALAAGADHVINYRETNVVDCVMEITDGDGVDHIVEVDFAANQDINSKILAKNSSIAAYSSPSNGSPELRYGAFTSRNTLIYFVALPTCPLEARRRAQSDIVRWASAGNRLFAIARRYPLNQAAAAHQLVESGGKVGTVILDIPGEDD